MDKEGETVDSVLMGCIYTPIWRGPIVELFKEMGVTLKLYPGTKDDYYLLLEMPGNIYYNAACFVELEDDENTETENKENAKVKEDPAIIHTGNIEGWKLPQVTDQKQVRQGFKMA